MPDPFEDWLKPISPAPAGIDDWASKIPDPFPDQERRMQEARVWANQKRGGENEFGFGLGLRLRTRDLSLPFEGAAKSVARGIAGVENDHEKRQKAQQAFSEGKATDEQLARLALYEYEDARNKSLGTAAAIGQGVAQAAPVVGEALVGGQAVKGIAGAVGLGSRLAPAATNLGRMGQSAAVQAAATPLTPGLWLDESQQRAAENGGNWYDPKNVAAPMVKAAFQNAIMGHLGEGTKGLGIAKRVGLGAALMPAEQAGADALTTLAEKGWKEAGMDEKWATKTEWGTIGQFMRGESGEGLKSLATQATLGGLFAGFHGQKSDPVGKLGKAVDSLAKDGVSQELAGRVIDEAMRRPPETIKNPEVKAFVESIIDLKPVEPPKTRSAGPSPEPVQPAPEAQKPAPAKPRTANEALAKLEDPFGEYTPKGPKVEYRPPAASERMVNESDAPTTTATPVEPRVKKGLGAKKSAKVFSPEEEAAIARRKKNQEEAEAKSLDDFFSTPLEVTKAEQAADAKKKESQQAEQAAGFDDAFADMMGMEKAAPIGGGFIPKEGLVVANIGKGGKIYYGRRGDIHASLSERFPHKDRGDWEAVGFAGPDGKFLTREQALEFAKKEGKVKTSENMKGQLDAMDYRESPKETIEEVERRIMEGKGPDGAERRRPTGLKLGQAEPITIDNARVSEIGDIDKFGKDHFRIDITDSEGNKVGELRLGAVGDTLHAPVGFADGLEFGKGRGKDQPFGSAEIMSLVEQVAALDPTAKKLVFTPSKGRIRAGVEKEFNLDKIRERVAKREAKQETKDEKYKREVDEMMKRHEKVEKELYDKYQDISKSAKNYGEQADAHMRYIEAKRANEFEKDELYRKTFKEPPSEPVPAERPAQEGTRVEEARPAEPVREPEPIAEPDGRGEPEAVAPRPVDDVPQWQRTGMIREQMKKDAAKREKAAKKEAESVVERIRSGEDVGEVSVPVAKATFQKLKAQDAEWREGFTLPKGETGKKLIDRIAKEVGRWSLPKTVTQFGWATDTKHAVKATPEMIEYSKKLGHDKIEGNPPPIDKVIPKKSDTVAASIKSQMSSDKETGTNQVHIASKDGKYGGIFDADYVANIMGIYPDAKIAMSKGKQRMAVFYDAEGNPVGLVMPLGDSRSPDKVSKHPALDIDAVFEKGKNDPKKMVSGRQVVTAEDGTFLAIEGSDTRKEWRIKDFPERKYPTIAQAQKAAREILKYAHGKDENGDLIFKIKGAKSAADPEGFGRTMTPEERAAGQVGGGAPVDLPPVEGGLKEIALANERVDAERAAMGLPPLMEPARKANAEVWDQAMAKLGRDPNVSADLVRELTKKMRATTVEENALLAHRMLQFDNEYGRTIRQANDAARKGNWAEFDRLSLREKELKSQIDELGKLTQKAGTEWGRAGQFRRQLIREDYSLGRMMDTLEYEKRAPLTPEERQKVQDQHDRIKALEERLRDFEAKEAAEADVIDLQPAEQKGLFQKAKEWLGSLFPRQRPTLGAAKKSKTWEFADRMEQDAAKELASIYGSGKLFSGFDPTGIPALAKYTAAKIIKSGLTFAEFSSQIVARFGDAVKPHIKEIWDGAQKHVEVGRLDKIDTQVELKKTKAEYAGVVDAFKRKNQSVGRKLWEGTKETNNLMRAVQTAWDVSAVGRQGIVLSLTHPTKVPAAMREMVQAIRSERGYERNQQEILSRRNALDYRLSELEFTDHNADPTRQEESLMGRYVQKLPGLAASSRAFNGYLNRLRADVFDAMTLNSTSTGPDRMAELKAAASWINAVTGRGKTGYKRIDDATQHLAQVFFSPRHALSRFQVLSGQPFWGAGTWKAKKMIAQEYAKYAIGMAAVYGLAKAVLGKEAEIEKDPRSSDFGKIKIGRTRIDPLAGFSQSAVVATRLGLGESKMPGTNEVKDLRGPGHKFKDPTTVKVAGQFIRNKMSPLGGEVADKLFPEFTPPGVGPLTDATGKKKGLGGWAIRQADKFQPLTAGDIYDAFKEHGIPRATAISLLNLLGWGSQVHEKQPRPK